jgi:Xaa-Pro aminopeptidase
VGGHIRWLCNEPANNGYPSTLVFPREGGASMIEQGPFDSVRTVGGPALEVGGVERRLGTPSYPSVMYSGAYDAEIALAELKRLGARSVGFVAPAGWYHGFGVALREGLADRRVVDATDWIDGFKAVKSEEELGFMQQVAAMQDEVMSRIPAFIKPGVRDFEIAAQAQLLGQQLGSEQGIFLNSSAPQGQAASFRPRHMQGRTLREGDVFSLLLENNGPGGYYTELSRIFVLGKASAAMQEAHAAVLEAQAHALTLLRPGTPCAEIHERHNAWLRGQGMAEERRLSIHGMGYDMVERPLIRHDETMTIEAGMAIVVHPGILNERMFIHNTEVYPIGADGPGPCLHRTPRRIFELA